jgi:hypothetical protein
MFEDMDKCQRCGKENDPDCRTLYHSCLYEMNELGLPFVQGKIVGKWHPYVGDKELSFGLPAPAGEPQPPMLTVPQFSTKPSDGVERSFYLLRVCKACRSDWMQSIKRWFNEAPATPQKRCGSGIFVREYGKTVEITEEEWARRYGDRVPVKVVNPKE